MSIGDLHSSVNVIKRQRYFFYNTHLQIETYVHCHPGHAIYVPSQPGSPA